MRPRFRKHPFLIAVLVLFAAFLQPRLALCVGDGGHTVLELRAADCCVAEAATHVEHALESASHGCASACTDIPVGSVLVLRGNDVGTGLDLLAHASCACVPSSAVHLSSACRALARDETVGIARPAPRAGASAVQRL